MLESMFKNQIILFTFFAVTLLAINVSKGQNLGLKEGKYSVQKTFTTSASEEKIYAAINEWMIANFNT